MITPLTISDFLDRAGHVAGLEEVGKILATELNQLGARGFSGGNLLSDDEYLDLTPIVPRPAALPSVAVPHPFAKPSECMSESRRELPWINPVPHGFEAPRDWQGAVFSIHERSESMGHLPKRPGIRKPKPVAEKTALLGALLLFSLSFG